MRVPKQLREFDDRDAVVRTTEYDDRSEIAIDFGTDAADMTVDVVGTTAIVVTGDRQFEFDVPADATDVSANNGVVTITD